MPSAAAVYARISDDRLGDEAGVRRQEDDCRRLAERRGWPVAEVYVDNDTSAYRSRSRPAYERLVDDLKTGRVDAVVTWHLDRLWRQPRDLEAFLDVCDQAGVKALATVTGDVDLGTADGRFMARILGAVASKESADKSRRIVRKHLELAQAGKDVGGGRPFGFEDDRVTIREDEADLIREAAARVLSGETVRGVVADWMARGVPTVSGAPWSTSVLRRKLTAGRTAGLREHHGKVVAEAVWPAIISREEHEELKALLLDARRLRNGGSNARKYLLAGFAYCGACGGRLVARPKQDKRRCYTCVSGPDFGGCGKIRRLAEPVEELVAEALFVALDSPEFAAALRDARRPADDEGSALAAELDRYEERKARLQEDHYVEGTLAKADYLRLVAEVDARADGARRRLVERAGSRVVDGLPAGAEAVRAWWEAAGLDRRRALVGALVERVVVHSALKGRNTFDPSRIEIVWRH